MIWPSLVGAVAPALMGLGSASCAEGQGGHVAFGAASVGLAQPPSRMALGVSCSPIGFTP